MSRYREPCGCVHDGHKWIEQRAPHEAEFRERHERAAADHARERESEKLAGAAA